LHKWNNNGYDPEAIMVVDPTDSRINEAGVLYHARKWEKKITEEQWCELFQRTKEFATLSLIENEEERLTKVVAACYDWCLQEKYDLEECQLYEREAQDSLKDAADKALLSKLR
jgi:hypothetical protein